MYVLIIYLPDNVLKLSYRTICIVLHRENFKTSTMTLTLIPQCLMSKLFSHEATYLNVLFLQLTFLNGRIHTHTQTQTHTHRHKHTQTHTHRQTDRHTHTPTPTHTNTHTHTHRQTHTVLALYNSKMVLAGMNNLKVRLLPIVT